MLIFFSDNFKQKESEMTKLIRYIARTWEDEPGADKLPGIAKVLPPFFYEAFVYLLIFTLVTGGLQRLIF